ncbi:uncharacterized protein FIESC28_03099 [Fusarium coffeatum]|uniref:Apple domain-containing protein n=1 Tax=Fusarium coffeatum TaxID=231269 RepID=A0A366S608_9HYPO|nr:uncharacterized protein FIESC28_03099 [Fusarium coffeatum]RBR24100.1 hypothetical protein FIESC28_03099 [Fusarium coffeatum]
MKTSTLYAYVALVGMASAHEPCVEGKRVTIRPNYIVEYKCNRYRLGQLHNNILSHEDCAAMCEATGLDVCTYHAEKKKCIVGDPNGTEGTRSGATYMVRVQEETEDPFPEDDDPFPETCEEQRDDLKTKLDQCRADLEAASKKPSCGVDKWGENFYIRIKDKTRSGCKDACNADPRCLSYSTYKGDGTRNCYLYDKETADVPDRTYPDFVQYDKRCG